MPGASKKKVAKKTTVVQWQMPDAVRFRVGDRVQIAEWPALVTGVVFRRGGHTYLIRYDDDPTEETELYDFELQEPKF